MINRQTNNTTVRKINTPTVITVIVIDAKDFNRILRKKVFRIKLLTC